MRSCNRSASATLRPSAPNSAARHGSLTICASSVPSASASPLGPDQPRLPDPDHVFGPRRHRWRRPPRPRPSPPRRRAESLRSRSQAEGTQRPPVALARPLGCPGIERRLRAQALPPDARPRPVEARPRRRRALPPEHLCGPGRTRAARHPGASVWRAGQPLRPCPAAALQARAEALEGNSVRDHVVLLTPADARAFNPASRSSEDSATITRHQYAARRSRRR